MPNCICKSGKSYKNCCEPFHKGEKKPKTALELMRSRYSAYANSLADYIIETTSEDNPTYMPDKEHWKTDILDFCQKTTFIDLQIISAKEENKTAEVTFQAFLSQGGKDFSFVEKSLFEKVDGKWLYKSGEILNQS